LIQYAEHIRLDVSPENSKFLRQVQKGFNDSLTEAKESLTRRKLRPVIDVARSVILEIRSCRALAKKKLNKKDSTFHFVDLTKIVDDLELPGDPEEYDETQAKEIIDKVEEIFYRAQQELLIPRLGVIDGVFKVPSPTTEAEKWQRAREILEKFEDETYDDAVDDEEDTKDRKKALMEKRALNGLDFTESINDLRRFIIGYFNDGGMNERKPLDTELKEKILKHLPDENKQVDIL